MTKHVIITGGAGGLGWQLAKLYWGQGCHLHLIDCDESALIRCAADLSERITTYVIDLKNETQIEQMCESLLQQQLSLHRLINNAGITHRSKATDTELAVFKNVMSINWLASVKLSQLLLPLLSKGNGKIICIASMAGLMPVPGRAAYCASKAALNQHFETWRPELRKHNVDLLLTFPSFVATNIEQNAIGFDGEKARHPQSTIGKLMSAEQMAERIMRADVKHFQRYYSPQIQSRIGFWLWTVCPKLFQKISWRNFRDEIE